MSAIHERPIRQPVDFHRRDPSSAAAPSPAASRRPHEDPAPGTQAYARVHDAPEYTAFLANVGRQESATTEISAAERVAAREAKEDGEVRARMDAFRDRFSGPYVVDGQSVSARPMFRMNTGFNDDNMRRHEAELAAICAKAGCRGALGAVKYGRPTPEQLVRVTQALIDAGKLAPGTEGSLELRIRQMQWEWGIGVDCSGYAQGALAAAQGKPTAQPSMYGVLSNVASNPAMRKIPIAEIRAGDHIRLAPPARGQVGHNVVVYDRAQLDEQRRAELARRSPDVAEFLGGDGPFHALLVDSSWGAGDGNDFGGFRRDTWLYDAGSERWGYFDPRTGALETSERGPQDEPFVGAFRPKAAR